MEVCDARKIQNLRLAGTQPWAGLTHEATNENAVSCLKDKKDGSDLKDTIFHDSPMFRCCSCVNPEPWVAVGDF